MSAISRSSAVLALGGVILACTATPYGATDANLSRAKERAALGGQLFARECAGCHGERGEGLANNPAIMGAGALARYPAQTASSTPQKQMKEQAEAKPGVKGDREAFDTAQDVYDYVSYHMPRVSQSKQPLKDEEYWAIVSYMLLAHGSDVPEGGANPSNAKSIVVKP